MFFDMDAANEYLAAEFAPSNCYAAETLAHSLRWRRAVILGDAIQVHQDS